MTIENNYRKKIINHNPKINDKSGIYMMTRKDENDIRHAYIGQAKHLLSRIVSHFFGYQHIDMSLKKHKLQSEDNPYGWKIDAENFSEKELDEKEKYYIKKYSNDGFQLKNKTIGGQGKGKVALGDQKPRKKYRDGLEQGRKNAIKEIAPLFNKYLTVSYKGDKITKHHESAMEKFNNYISETEDNRRIK